MAIYDILSAFTNWLWGIPILILLVTGGFILTLQIQGIQFSKIGFIVKNTVGTLFDKELQKQKKAAGISPVQALTAALGATVGTGNIVGVGVAIATGGPGALFWMWVCGFLAMAIKYSEVTMSIQYRRREPDGSYRGGPFMYMRDGLHCMPLAVAFGIMMLVCLCTICLVHGSAISSNLASLNVPNYVSCVIMVIFMAVVLFGGMKGLVAISDWLVPLMSILYLTATLVIVLTNVGSFGTVFASILQGAFTGTAAVGGFAGAAFATAVRNGLARGVFSNDAGLGLSASLQAQAEAIDHPAQQGMWAIVETFIDTIIISSMTGFAILFSGVWQSGADGATLAASALGSVLGDVGRIGCVICLVMFGLSSLISDLQGVLVQSVAMFDSRLVGRGFQALIIVAVIYGSFANISKAFMFADFGNGIVLLLNVPALILLGKTLRAVTKEWFDHKGDLKAIEEARKNK